MVWNWSRDDLFLRRHQDVFQETSQDVLQKTSSGHLQGDVLKTSLSRLKTSRLFPVKANDHLETIHGLSIYVRFKLLSSYHSITRQTNWINLKKPNALKDENSMEILKLGLLWSVRLEHTFHRSLNIFSISEKVIYKKT